MKRSPVVHRLLALFVAGCLVFGFPLLELWLPSPALLFVLWGVLIVLVARAVERSDDEG